MNRIITLLTIFGLIGNLEASFSNSQIKEAAQKCCTPNRYECCMDMIKFGTQIKCGYERDPKIPALVYNCMQQELFAQEPEKRMNLDGKVEIYLLAVGVMAHKIYSCYIKFEFRMNNSVRIATARQSLIGRRRPKRPPGQEMCLKAFSFPIYPVLDCISTKCELFEAFHKKTPIFNSPKISNFQSPTSTVFVVL
ncbi:hypothetical protein B9Z55_020275 [Caenorhabditis nigoni]|uniref:Domain of unknown function DB domain-containing protein n=1 Tax=Caenorhabditis nigoni TaxID=1611254 RepID=A0A2G5TM30_9PELO|nr:hypothetical protein B9Z55_020275 [Caenorhabditis nigoni]